MKKTSFAIVMIGLILTAACSPPNGKQAQLSKLERQRDELDRRIEKVKAEMALSSSLPAREHQKVQVLTQTIVPGEFRHFITIQGTVESDSSIRISPRASGLVTRLYVQAGDSVSEGKVLAELDDVLIQSSIAEVEQALDLATTIFERQQRLWKKNIGSELEFLQAKNGKESLEKKLATLYEQRNLLKITAPISGTVDGVFIKEGEMAAAGMTAFQIVRLSELKVSSELAENHIVSIRKNDPVRIAVPVLNKEFSSSIKAVSQVIDLENRTFRIEMDVPKGERDIRPNMLAVVTVNDYINPEALIIPQNVIQETGGEKFVFVAIQEGDAWIARKRIISTGRSQNNRIEILSGLAPGEQVITQGFQKIGDGQLLTIDHKE